MSATKPSQPSPENKDGSILYGDTDDRVIAGHTYDGIKEYDNPMPGWWVWTFVATVIFSVFYFVGIEYFGWVDTYEDDLEQSLAELQVIREAYAAHNPSFEVDEASLATYLDDASAIDAGRSAFTTYCAACHGAEGQGTIGPNLTDDHWIHGGSLTEIYEVIANGVGAKGMPPWQGTLSAEEMAQVTAYIRSIHGTEPANAKAPEGELVEE